MGSSDIADRGRRRRRVTKIAIVFATFVIFVNGPSVRVHGQSLSAWPQFRGDARLTGTAAQAPPDTLKLQWTYEAPEGIESSAAIADGAVYVGAANGDLLAVDLESGKLRWK